MSSAGHVGSLHVAAVPSRVHDARSVVFTHNPNPTVDPMLNVHSVSVDGADRSVGANARLFSTLQTDVPGACWLMRAASSAGPRVPVTRRRVPLACRRVPTARGIRVACSPRSTPVGTARTAGFIVFRTLFGRWMWFLLGSHEARSSADKKTEQ